MNSQARVRLALLGVAVALALAGCAAGPIGALGATLLWLALGLGASACYSSSGASLAGLQGDSGVPIDADPMTGDPELVTSPPGTHVGPINNNSVPPARPDDPDPDRDGDGYPASKDCNDADPTINPGAVDTDPCDNVVHNCAFTSCNSFQEFDYDGDGYAAAVDCNDANALVHPGASDDPCDGVDSNCDGVEASCNPLPDGDGDGYAPGIDCDDTNPNIHPGAYDPDFCDGLDENCDSQEFACNILEDAGAEDPLPPDEGDEGEQL